MLNYIIILFFSLLVNENYDVFISYARADKEFAKEILEVLENKFHITACIDYRDFLPGVNKLEQIAQVIEKQCRTVIVIYSEDYFNCELCDYQAKIAMSFSLGKFLCLLLLCAAYEAYFVVMMGKSSEPQVSMYFKTLLSSITLSKFCTSHL